MTKKTNDVERKSKRNTNFNNTEAMQFISGQLDRSDQINRYQLKKLCAKHRQPITTVVTIDDDLNFRKPL